MSATSIFSLEDYIDIFRVVISGWGWRAVKGVCYHSSGGGSSWVTPSSYKVAGTTVALFPTGLLGS